MSQGPYLFTGHHEEGSKNSYKEGISREISLGAGETLYIRHHACNSHTHVLHASSSGIFEGILEDLLSLCLAEGRFSPTLGSS